MHPEEHSNSSPNLSPGKKKKKKKDITTFSSAAHSDNIYCQFD